MRARYLIDKSALARMPHESVRQRLAQIFEAGEAATCSVIDLEILYSARNADDHERIRQRRKLAYAQIPLSEEIFQRAIAVQGMLARTGHHRVPIPDLIIAATAEMTSLTVLHYDSDFDRIAEITGQLTEWVVPRGMI